VAAPLRRRVRRAAAPRPAADPRRANALRQACGHRPRTDPVLRRL